MIGDLGNLGDLMKQAREAQKNIKKVQQELAKTEVVGVAGGGMVKITMDGRHEVKLVQIDSALLGSERDMLEDMIAGAVNDANRRVQRLAKEKMSGLGSFMGMPSGFKWPL